MLFEDFMERLKIIIKYAKQSPLSAQSGNKKTSLMIVAFNFITFATKSFLRAMQIRC